MPINAFVACQVQTEEVTKGEWREGWRTLPSGRRALMMGEGWVDRCEPTSVTRGVYCHEAMTDVLWGILGGVLKNGYKLDRRKGSETLFHTESTARVCKGVGIERAWPPGHGVERAWLSYRLRTLTQVVYWLGRWRRVEARLRKLLYAKEHFC